MKQVLALCVRVLQGRRPLKFQRAEFVKYVEPTDKEPGGALFSARTVDDLDIFLYVRLARVLPNGTTMEFVWQSAGASGRLLEIFQTKQQENALQLRGGGPPGMAAPQNLSASLERKRMAAGGIALRKRSELVLFLTLTDVPAALGASSGSRPKSTSYRLVFAPMNAAAPAAARPTCSFFLHDGITKNLGACALALRLSLLTVHPAVLSQVELRHPVGRSTWLLLDLLGVIIKGLAKPKAQRSISSKSALLGEPLCATT